MKTVSIIRDRGQLTIPDSIRKSVKWANPLAAVTITVTKSDEIVITPHQNQTDWKKIDANMKKLHAHSGKSTLSAAEFIAQDRQNH